MKRDLDLIRAILMAVEDSGHDLGSWMDLSIEGKTQLELSYHVQLLHEAGLIEAIDLSTKDGMHWEPKKLTWSGHEFLDDARNDTTWQRAKKIVGTRIGSASLDVVQGTLTQVAKEFLQ